jgi:hypothetical protein
MTVDMHLALVGLADEIAVAPGDLPGWQRRAKARVRRRRAAQVVGAAAAVVVASFAGVAVLGQDRSAGPALYGEAGGSHQVRIGDRVTLTVVPPSYDVRQNRTVPAGPAPLGPGSYVALLGDDLRGINITVRQVTANPLPADLSTLGLDVRRETIRGHPGVSYRLSHDFPATGKLLRRDHVVAWLERPGLWIEIDVSTSPTDTAWRAPLAQILQSMVTR